jgi:hypothetical protein
MRLTNEHTRFIAEKIARELVNSKLVGLTKGDAPVIGAANRLLEEEVRLERAVDGESNRIIDKLEDNLDLFESIIKTIPKSKSSESAAAIAKGKTASKNRTSAKSKPIAKKKSSLKGIGLLSLFIEAIGSTEADSAAIAKSLNLLVDQLKTADLSEEDQKEIRDLPWMIRMSDPRTLFWMIKREIAPAKGLILDKDDRFNNLAHRILDDLYEEDLINYSVSENLVKNVIGKAILDYGRRQEEIEDRVHERIKKTRRDAIRGSEEYDILFSKYYEEELRKLGL